MAYFVRICQIYLIFQYHLHGRVAALSLFSVTLLRAMVKYIFYVNFNHSNRNRGLLKAFHVKATYFNSTKSDSDLWPLTY